MSVSCRTRGHCRDLFAGRKRVLAFMNEHLAAMGFLIKDELRLLL